MKIDISNVVRGDIVHFKSYSLRVEAEPAVVNRWVVLKGRTNVNGSPFVTKKFLPPLEVTVDRENKNPVGSAKAKRLYKGFMLRAPTRSKIVNLPALPKEALAIGFVSGIIYESDRGGGRNTYRHDFTKGSRPLLAVSNDGQQLVLIGGSYQFTKRGITDK